MILRSLGLDIMNDDDEAKRNGGDELREMI